ncbi:MAG: M48 family metallopeptidase [Bacteroidales bacterium]|nr:M48 family metallopeptidase [Bacteroidales bacterium]
MNNINYPSSPDKVPDYLTILTPSYKFKAALAIFSIILFFVLYVALVVSLCYLTYYAIYYPVFDVNRFSVMAKIGAVAGSAMLLIFTLKFLFKLRNFKPKNRVKLKADEYPELFDFIKKVCAETNAPKPKNIYIDPDVNAYVSYTNVWLSLFLPMRKTLTIGLGLVSSVNLSEFKAVIAHEFGHFSQRAMKIGSYIISANTIIHDMIYERDRWDNILDQWRNSDLRLSFAAWIITPVVWAIRQLLALFYKLLNVMYSSLSREMEFNADKVAIKTTGSDAIISALWKLDYGVESWNNTINNAYLAAQKDMFVKNLYVHNTSELDLSSDKQQQVLKSLQNHPNGGKQYFTTSENSKVGMYASHPPNNLREDNAKLPYIECKQSTESPWTLFPQKNVLQEQLSQVVYEQYLDKKRSKYVTKKEFEEFIKAEKQGSELLAEYFNTFQDRYITIPEQKELDKCELISNEHLISQLIPLKDELQELMKPVQEIEALMQKAQQIAEGTTKEKSFEFNSKNFTKKNLEEGFNQMLEKREDLFNSQFKDWDTRFCMLHVSMAKSVNRTEDLFKLYSQHKAITDIYKKVSTAKNSILITLNRLQTQGDVEQHELSSFEGMIKKEIKEMNDLINSLDEIEFVPMPNIQSVKELKEAIIENGNFVQETGQLFENGGFDRVMNAIESATHHCQRLDQKSIGVILALHHELQKEIKAYVK